MDGHRDGEFSDNLDTNTQENRSYIAKLAGMAGIVASTALYGCVGITFSGTGFDRPENGVSVEAHRVKNVENALEGENVLQQDIDGDDETDLYLQRLDGDDNGYGSDVHRIIYRNESGNWTYSDWGEVSVADVNEDGVQDYFSDMWGRTRYGIESGEDGFSQAQIPEDELESLLEAQDDSRVISPE